MQVETVAIDTLVPYDLNNRKHSAEQVERIARSIKEFGFNQPIVIDEDSVILVGHGRLLAAEKLGLKEVPVLQLHNLSEKSKRAYRILDNKLQNDSEWDFGSLSVELDFLESQGVDLEGWGLDDLKSMFPEPEIEVVEDEGAGEVPEETYIKRGDLIELGRHRVMCGDSSADFDIESLMGDKKAPLTLTDPPYNIAGENEVFAADVSASMKALKDSSWDLDFVPSKFLSATERTRSPDSWLYVFTSHHLFGAVVDWVKENRNQSGFIAWCKPNPMPSLMKKAWTSSTELAVFSKIGAPVFHFPEAGHALNWIKLEKSSDGTHPTQKPIALFAEIVKRSSDVGDLVADWFLGSGTTLIACEQLNRTCYGMEISPNYCQVIIERYKKFCEKEGKAFECKINGVKFDG